MLANAQTAGTTGEGAGGARLTPRERRALLEDIGRIAFTLGQSSVKVNTRPPQEDTIPGSPGRHLRQEAITSPLERLHLLAELWQEVQPALAAILREPDTRLVENSCPVQLSQARGGPRTAGAIARSPHLAAAWKYPDPAPESLPTMHTAHDRKQPAAHPHHALVQESRSSLTTNTWANRLAARILADFTREASELERLALFCEAQAEAETAAQIAKTARSLRTHPVLRDCPALTDREAAPALCASRIMRCALQYQTLYTAWRQLACPLDFDWTHSPLLTLPALEPWHLYEIWCLLQVSAALHQAGWNRTRGSLLQPTPRGLRLIPATGRASRLDFERKEEKEKRRRGEEKTRDTRYEIREGENSSFLLPPSSFVSLYYQPLFSSANQQSGHLEREGEKNTFAFVSRSHAMQPDMALYWREKLYLLDPKFRVYAQRDDAQEDVNKMHAYRDAIARRGSRSDRAPSPVEAAWCLFPGSVPDETVSCDGKVVAYPVASQDHPFGTAGVGALQLRPGHPQTTTRLAELLKFLLK